MAGMTSTAPSPSTIDQPRKRNCTFGLNAVISEPAAYTYDPITNALRRPHTSPSLAPNSMNAAIVRV